LKATLSESISAQRKAPSTPSDMMPSTYMRMLITGTSESSASLATPPQTQQLGRGYCPLPKKKLKHIGWLLHDDYSEEEDDDGEDGHAAMGRVAPGENNDGDDGDDGDDEDKRDERYDDFVTGFVTPKRRNKQMNKPKQRNKKLVKHCTRKKRKTTINPDAKKGRRQSTLV